MPELPEVETIRLLLASCIVGKKIISVEIREPKQFVGEINNVAGAKITAALRKGKVLTLILDNGYFINIHLKLTGQVLYAAQKSQATFDQTIPFAGGKTMPGVSTRIILELSDCSAIFYNDIRKFGWMKVTTKPEVPPSVDVLAPEFTTAYLAPIIQKTKKPIKVLLMDQEYIAGIGNIYANDSLWEAGINPLRKSNTLTLDEITRLHESIMKTIHEGLKYKGSSARDEIYVLPDGSKGGYQHHFKVYHREGQPCLRCKTLLVRVKQAGRSSFFCPRCQI